jgi:hypothetical protein
MEIAWPSGAVRGWQRVALLEALVFAGITLPPDKALAIVDPVVRGEQPLSGIFRNPLTHDWQLFRQSRAIV